VYRHQIVGPDISACDMVVLQGDLFKFLTIMG
jgi:hypothetical protein